MATRAGAHIFASDPTAIGTLDATLPSLGALASGLETFTGTISATLPSLGALATGAEYPTGTISATLPSLGVLVTGVEHATGTISATFPSLSALLSGVEVVSGSIAATLPSIGMTSSGMVADGSISATLPSLGASITATHTASSALPTLTKLYEEINYKKLSIVLAVGGHVLPSRTVSYSFEIGSVPTLSFEIDNIPPAFVHELASVHLFVGFNGLTAMVFNGQVESVSGSESGVNVQCSGQSKKLDAPYVRTVTTTDGVTSANDLIVAIFDVATVGSRFIDVGSWVPGTVQPQPLQFQTYGEAVNKIAEPFASPYYEMPDGQIRVDLRDAIPAPEVFRTYFSDILQSDLSYEHPTRVTNATAKPRIVSVNQEKLSRDVRNKVTVRGAEVPVSPAPPSGEHAVVVLEETASALSPWIPPINGVDQYVDLVIDNNLLDTILDVANVAARYLDLTNRLMENVTLHIAGDPQIFLGATVGVVNLDPFTGIDANYFVKGYTTTISDSEFSTELQLVGGRAAGTTPRLTPFAMFTWTNRYMPVIAKDDFQKGNGKNNYPNGAKMLQYVPVDTGSADTGAGIDGKMQIITFDASPSVDPDGIIVSYAWSDTQGHVASGKRVTILYDPSGDSSTDMTLTVTDNDGFTSTQTESVNLTGFGPQDGFSGDDSTSADQSNNGGVSNDSIVFVAAQGGAAAVFGDGTFNFIAGGPCYCVAAMSNAGNEGPQDANIAFFGVGSQVRASYDYCASLNYTSLVVPAGRILGIACSDGGVVRVALINSDGPGNMEVWESSDFARTWALNGIGLDSARSLLQYTAEDRVGPGFAYVTVPSIGQDAESVLFNHEDSYSLAPGADSQYVPDNSSPDASVSLTGGDPVGLAPGQEPSTFYAVDSTGATLKTTDGSNFTSVNPTPPVGLTRAYTAIGEPGMEGVFLVGADNGVYKSPDGGATMGLITPAWPGGEVWQIVSSNKTRFAPPGDLYAITG